MLTSCAYRRFLPYCRWRILRRRCWPVLNGESRLFSAEAVSVIPSVPSTSTISTERILDFEIFDPSKIRNFCIIAHVDHGKSTLADRLMEKTGAVRPGGPAQRLDSLEVERQRGITIKSQTCTMLYRGHLLNLIDTPGHADFSYEVTRSLAACDGVLLLVAANEGVQAQTIANFWLALDRGVSIVPVLNKVDLQVARPDQVAAEIESLFELHDPLRVSAKTGLNVDKVSAFFASEFRNKVLDAVVDRIPPPGVGKDGSGRSEELQNYRNEVIVANRSSPFRGLIVDAHSAPHKGTIATVIVRDGVIKKGGKLRSLRRDELAEPLEITELGVFRPQPRTALALYAGQLGYVIFNAQPAVINPLIGDTLYSEDVRQDRIEPLKGFKAPQPTVFAGLFPAEAADYEKLSIAIEKLCLNDPAVTIEPDSSQALGLGWRLGFHGVLHMEVFGERLEKEQAQSVVLTTPSVEYRALVKENETIRKKRYGGAGEIRIRDATQFPTEPMDIERFLEPMIKLRMVVPVELIGAVGAMCAEARGDRGEVTALDNSRALMVSRIPLAEVITDFFARLKRITAGAANFDYEDDGYREANLIRLTITINNKEVPEFAQVIPAAMAKERARLIVNRLKNQIPRQQYEVVITAHSGVSSKKHITQAQVAPMKRDFMQLLKGNYGKGGKDRLNKKLSHQKEGKERMKMIGNIQVPREAFRNVLKTH